MSVESIITENLDIWTSAIKTKSASGRGSSNKLELYGIKKLRDLILTLGVQGKLTGDNEIEDSASELLNEITSIREALVENEGLKTKASHKINDSEIYFDVPESWSVSRLGNLAKFIDYRGKTPNKIEKGVRLITAKNVRFGYLSLEPAEYISEDEYTAWMTRGFPQKGDLLFTPEAPLGNVAVIDLTEKFALAQRAICFQFHKTEITPFLKYFMMSSAFQSKLIAESSGMTATGIKASKLKEIIVPLPSLSEQRTIVHKIEELMALCDQLESQTEASIEAHQTLVKLLLETLTNAKDADELNESWQRISAHFDVLFTTEDSIDQLKQTILQLAVMGKLVKQDPNDEPASKLLESIEAEREQLIKDKKIKKQKSLSEIDKSAFAFKIPENWAVVRLDSLINPEFPISYGVLVPGPDVNNGIPLVRVGDLSDNLIHTLPEKSISPKIAAKYQRTTLEGGEILMAVVGSIGKVCIAPIHWKGANIARALCRIKTLDKIDDAYLLMLLKSPLIQDIFRADTRTLAQPTLNINLIKMTPLLLPPLAEQIRIKQKVTALFEVCEKINCKLKEKDEMKVVIANELSKYSS